MTPLSSTHAHGAPPHSRRRRPAHAALLALAVALCGVVQLTPNAALADDAPRTLSAPLSAPRLGGLDLDGPPAKRRGGLAPASLRTARPDQGDEPRSGARGALLGDTSLRLNPPDGDDAHSLGRALGANDGSGRNTGSAEPRRRRVIRNGAYVLYFYEYDPFDKESFLHILGLYWHRSKPDYSFNLVVPFGAHWTWKDGSERWGLITPLVWHNAGSRSTYTGAWLYHCWRSPESELDLIAPLGWRYRDPRDDNTLWVALNAFWRTRPGRTDFGLIPLAWGATGPDVTEVTVLPLFRYTSSPRDSSFISVLYFQNHEADTETTFAGIPAALTFWEDDPDTTTVLQFPLLYTQYDKRTGDHGGWIPPLMAFWSNDADSDLFLQFPLFLRYRDHDEDATLTMITPLMLGYEAPDWSFGMLAPLYFGYEDDDTDLSIITPLLYARYRDGDDYHFGMLGPLYYERDALVWNAGLFPLIHFKRDAETNERLSMVAPLYFGWDNAGSVGTVIPPLLFANTEDKEDGERFFLAGPLYTWSRGNQRAHGLMPLFFHSRDDDLETEFNFIPGLWYHTHSPEHVTDAWGPIFKHHDADGDYVGVFPLALWRHDNATDISDFFMLPFFYGASGPETFGVVAGPAWFWRDDETSSEGLLPLYARHRWDDGSHLLFLPGLFDYVGRSDGDPDSDPDWRFTWLLNGFRFADSDGSERTTVVPLFASGKDPDGTSWALALPGIFTVGNVERDERFILAPPLIYDRDAEGTSWAALPLAFGHSDPELSWWAFLPFALDVHDRTDDTHFTLAALPLFGRYSQGDTSVLGSAEGLNAAPASHTGWLGPLFWSDTNARRLRLLVPLIVDYANYEDKTELTIAGPLWARWRSESEGTMRSLETFALLYGRYDEVYPNGERDTTHAVGPIFGYSGVSGNGWGLAPIFWHDREYHPEGDSGHDILFPLVWSFFDDALQTETRIIGPLYSVKEPGDHAYGLAPLYFHRETVDLETGRHETSATAPPLFWYSSAIGGGDVDEAFLLTPIGYHDRVGDTQDGYWLNYYYMRQGDDTATDAFLPIYYSHTSPTLRKHMMAPFYYASQDLIHDSELLWAFPYLGWREGETADVDMVLPLFFQHRNPTSGDLMRLVLPGYLQIEDGATGSQFVMGGPVWYKGDGWGGYDTGLFPLLWWGEESDEFGEDSYAVAFPFFWRFVEDDDRWTVLTPGWYHSHDDGYSAGVLPLGFVQEDRADDVFRAMLGPVYYSDVDDEQTLITPLYAQQTREGRYWHLAPLVFHASDRDAQTATTWAGPFYGHRSPEGEWMHIMPLFWSAELADDSAWWALAPLYFGGREANGDRWDLLFPLGARGRSADGSEGYLVAGPYLDFWEDDDWFGGLLPLYLGWRDGSARRRIDTVAGLFWSWEDEDTGGGGTVIGPAYHVQEDDGDAHYGLAPLAHLTRKTDGSTTGWLAPIAYVNNDVQEERWSALIGPLYASHDAKRDRTSWAALPLAGGVHEPDYSAHGVFPLYYSESTPDAGTFVSPVAYIDHTRDAWRAWSLLYAGWGDNHDTHHAVFPLFYSRRSADKSGLDIVLPFYAHFNSGADRSGGTVLFPLYWNFYDKDAGTASTVLFPLYWNVQDPKRNLLVLGPWFHSERKDAKRTTHGLVPLYYYSEDPGGYTFNLLGGFVGIDHTRSTQENRYQLLWLPF